MQKHKIKTVLPGSIAERMALETGDFLIFVNGREIEDALDYRYQINEEILTITVEKADGSVREIQIEKEYDEDLGIEFETDLMDDYRSCHNKCIFCFIDQMPPGMRETLYFKDDDSRLSFLQGNYITLTNMKEKDIDRIISQRMSPINISIQSMNPGLRCRMLNNRFAGDVLAYLPRLKEAGIVMNGQIVLCKGVNDGEELEYSIRELAKLMPEMQSVSVVPAGLTKYREGLYPLEPFTKAEAAAVIDVIERWQKKLYAEYGMHMIHASDEWYILAERDFPEEGRYDGYPQLENGVGMMRLMKTEFEEGFQEIFQPHRKLHFFHKKAEKRRKNKPSVLSVATGELAYGMMRDFADRLMAQCPWLTIHVYRIVNQFFGPAITVSGLITGQDLIEQLAGAELGERLLLPSNMIRAGERVFLDDVTVDELENTLQTKVNIVKSNGKAFILTVLGEESCPDGGQDGFVYIKAYPSRR